MMEEQTNLPLNSEEATPETTTLNGAEDWDTTIRKEAALMVHNYDAVSVANRIANNIQRIVMRGREGFVISEAMQDTILAHIQTVLGEQLIRTLRDALNRAEIETQKRTMRELNDTLLQLPPDRLNEWSEQAARDARTESRRRQELRMRGGREPEYPLTGLREQHEQLKPVWRDAKRLYRQNGTRQNWREIIATVHSDLPGDLLNKLSLQGESGPAELALEHAARQCGVPPNRYSIRQLWERLRND